VSDDKNIRSQFLRGQRRREDAFEVGVGGADGIAQIRVNHHRLSGGADQVARLPERPQGGLVRSKRLRQDGVHEIVYHLPAASLFTRCFSKASNPPVFHSVATFIFLALGSSMVKPHCVLMPMRSMFSHWSEKAR